MAKCRINGKACNKAFMEPGGRCVDVRGPYKDCLLKMIEVLEAQLAEAEGKKEKLLAMYEQYEEQKFWNERPAEVLETIGQVLKTKP